MAVEITIRDVPERLRDELALRAAREQKSMQAYLLGELERIVRRPTVDRRPTAGQWIYAVRARKAKTKTRIPASEILRLRDLDRI